MNNNSNNCTNKENNTAAATSCNYIRESVIKIDKMQKEILCDNAYSCISCNTSLLSVFNTIPISLYTCCGNPITGLIGPGGDTTTFFRIESVRCGKYVTLRLLESTDGTDPTLTGTDFTMIVDLDCIGQIQCFSPITVEVCTGSTPVEE